nr:MAG TPA: Guanylate kinase [Bacteriophage sp.]
MIILLGKSASGKDTVVNNLIHNYGYEKIITWTTRPMRPGEKQDLTYHFTDDEDFEEKIEEGFFAEWKKYNSVFGTWYYGTAVQDITNNPNNKIIILTPSGYEDIKEYINDEEILSVYLDSSLRTLYKRLKFRGDNPKEIKRRLLHDIKDFKGIKNKVNVVIKNNTRDLDELTELIKDMHDIVKNKIRRDETI